MRYRSFLITLLALAMVAALATVALAGKPDCDVDSSHASCKPTTTTTVTTSTTVPGYWTCQARIENGAIWPLGDYDGTAGTYMGDGPALCVDIISDHLGVTNWLVEWSGTTAKGTVKGLNLVFEEEVHGTVYAEAVVHDTSGTWEASWSDPVKNLVFVAMPHSADKWIGPMIFTITPMPTLSDG